MRRLDAWIAWTACLLPAPALWGADCGSADLWVKNAHFITVDDARRIVSAAAVR